MEQRCTELPLPLRLHSAVKSPSISLAPHCSEHLTQKPAERHTSHHAPLVIHSLHRQGCGGLAPDIGSKADVPVPLCYWWDLNITPEHFFKSACSKFAVKLWAMWSHFAKIRSHGILKKIKKGLTWNHSNNALISDPISSQWARE